MSTEIKNFPNAESLIISTRMKPSTFRPQTSDLRPQTSEPSTRKIAEEFASLLLVEMLKSMRATLSGEGLDGDKSSSRDTYAALADVEVTRVLAKRDGIGLTDFLEKSLHRMGQMVDAQTISSMKGEEEGL
jgi:Rod binding domain-containing protein